MLHTSLPRRAASALAAMSFLCVASAASGQSPDTELFVGEISGSGATVSFGAWKNVTQRAGYDNQPSFTPDSRSILYTVQSDGQTDIYRHDLATGSNERVTSTAESEYSAAVMPGGDRFSAIRVEADSTQRLWSFRMDGSAPELVLSDVAPVGYQAWLDERTLALFVLGRPSTLQIADSRTGEPQIRAHDIGRSLHRVPGRHAVSFIHRDGGVATIRSMDPHNGTATDRAPDRRLAGLRLDAGRGPHHGCRIDALRVRPADRLGVAGGRGSVRRRRTRHHPAGGQPRRTTHRRRGDGAVRALKTR